MLSCSNCGAKESVSTHSSTVCPPEKLSTAAHSSPSPRTVLPPSRRTPTAKPRHTYSYSNHHHQGNPYHRPSNQRCSNRRWTIYHSPSIAKVTDTKSKNTSSTDASSTAEVAAKVEVEEKEKRIRLDSESSGARQTSIDQQQKQQQKKTAAAAQSSATTTEEVTAPRSQTHTASRRLGTGSGSKYRWRRRSVSSSEWTGAAWTHFYQSSFSSFMVAV